MGQRRSVVREDRNKKKNGHYPHFEEQVLFDATLLEWAKRN
jgi:hypothetical protein